MMSGCSQHDIKMFSPAGQAGRAEITFIWMPPAKAAPLGVSLQTRCHRVPCRPPGGPAPPVYTGQLGKGEPTSSALAVGRLHLDGAVHLQHTSGSGRSVVVPCPPPQPFPWGTAGFGPSLAQGAGKGPARTEPGLVGTGHRGRQGHRAMLRPWGWAPEDGHPVLQAPAGRRCQPWPPACFPRLQRTAEAAAAPGQPGGTATSAPRASFPPNSSLLPCVTAVRTRGCDMRVQQDTPGTPLARCPAEPFLLLSPPPFFPPSFS